MYRFCRNEPVLAARLGVEMVLRAYVMAKTAADREQIAAEIARLDGGGVRLELADLSGKFLAGETE
jgi:hypothetical protein